jgi:hypothetical protein
MRCGRILGAVVRQRVAQHTAEHGAVPGEVVHEELPAWFTVGA